MQKSFLSFLFLGLASFSIAQKPQMPTSAEIYQKLQKLNVLGSVLYMAAHPDDENTALIAYYANQKLYNTNYLSLTRGDGGQNLVGPELREKLGIIRTQELLQARRIDGGHQYFATANDFGFSKNPEEVFTKWDKDSLLANAVWIIRNVQPDVMITRFPKDSRAGHGQHSASSILAEEAFEAAGDPTKFPEQLKYVKPWKVKRLVWNTSSWAFGSKADFDKYAANLLHLDIGVFNPYLGKSIGEIAAESRSMHRSQAFGSAGARRSIVEYFEPTMGIPAKQDLFEDINTTWTRVPHSDSVETYIQQAIAGYDLSQPDKVLPSLLNAYRLMQGLPDSFWKKEKIGEIKDVIKNVLGLYMTSTVNQETVSPSDPLTISTEVTNRSTIPVFWENIQYSTGESAIVRENLTGEKSSEFENGKVVIPKNMPYSQHYWLKMPYNDAMYQVENLQDLNAPENLPALTTQVTLKIGTETIDFELPVMFKKVDPAKGELFNPLVVTPRGFVNLDNTAYMFPNGQPKKVTLKVIADSDPVNGMVSLNLPKGWKATPAQQNVQLEPNNETDFSFDVTPAAQSKSGTITGVLTIGGEKVSLSQELIQYDHIPMQVYMPKAEARAENFDVQIKGKNIGYLMGAGDAVPAGLKQIGYRVTLLQDKDMTAENLKQYDAIMMGVRAYNTLPRIAHYQDVLLDYAKNGGTVVAQYNVFRGLLTKQIGPYSMRISNDRVTDENAKVSFINPKHSALNYPNKITEKDFDGWVQERGLYFPDQWDKRYQTIIACHDPKEKDLAGGILIAPYGKGYYVYSVYDWFRELPAGVPGAYRLLANLLSLGK